MTDKQHPKAEKYLTRRQLLKTLTAGAVGASIGTSVGEAFGRGSEPTIHEAETVRTYEPSPRSLTSTAVSPKAHAFSLTDVRLLESPFKKAQQLDAKYLLQLEPDRLLHNFRVNAGLKPKAPVYGGWESLEPWIDIRCQGHTLGHYLSACSLMYASTNDPVFKRKIDYSVKELRECQVSGKTGLICAFPDGSAPLDKILNTTRFVGVPWYTMHKIFAGLRDAYLYTSNKMALVVLVKLSDWAINHTKGLSDEQFQKMLGTEHGGMNEILADVYSLTGEERFLLTAKRFCHRALLDPLSERRDTLDGLHSNTQIPKVIGFNRLYELTSELNYGEAARFFWTTVVNKRSFVTGGNGDGEHFFPPADFSRHLTSAKTMETCCSHNMLKLTRGLFTMEPSATLADYYERALYNSILASQDPDSGMMTYFQPTRPGYLKLYCTPFDSFWCCTGSGIENHAKYGDSIYFHNADSLYVNLFIPSVVSWKEKDLSLTQTTRFPEEEITHFRVTTRRPVHLSLNIRHPSWCSDLTINVNGRRWTQSNESGRYVTIERRWRSGDTIEVMLPMTLHTEALPGRNDVLAFMYGPIVLAGTLGKKGLTPGADIIVNERTVGDVLKDPVEVPTLRGNADELVKSIRWVDESSLTFRTDRVGEPSEVTLIPYFRVAHERYSIYWTTRT